LPKGDPARKLAVLHMQEVHISQIVTSVCFVDAGIRRDEHRAMAYAARDAFEATLPDIVSEIAALDAKDPAVRHLQREIGKKKEMWYRFRVFVDRELKAEEPSTDVLAQLALMEGNLISAIERVYRVVKRKMAKSGEVDLATIMQEQATFNLVFKAQRVIEESCLVASGVGDALERAKLGEAIEHFEQELSVASDSPLVGEEAKAVIPTWQGLVDELRALSAGGTPAPDLLPRLLDLQQRWNTALGLESLMTAVG
ncbi:MAG: hypothetical protein AAF899_19675, partial [Pseudomonadota bacterium]